MRDSSLLDSATDAARIRAMYVDPARARRRLGRAMLALCEQSARAAGFARAQLMATRAGEPLYLACGCAVAEGIDRMAAVGMAVPGPS